MRCMPSARKLSPDLPNGGIHPRCEAGADAWPRLSFSGGTIPETVILDVIDFFEDLGTALRAGSLSKEQAFNGFSTAARNYWAVCGQNFAGELKKSGDPTFYTEFEYFVREVNRLRERKAGKPTDLTKTVLDEFLASEASLS